MENNDGVIDLAAYKKARAEAKAKDEEPKHPIQSGKRLLYIENDMVVFDHPDLDHTLSYDADNALEFARQLTTLGGLLRAHLRAKDPIVIAAREQERKRKEQRARVQLVGKSGKKLPPLKLAGWAIETIGGNRGSSDTRWYRMTRPYASRLHAEIQKRRIYIPHHGEERVRVVPVDFRGRVIPPERMPKDAETVGVVDRARPRRRRPRLGVVE